MILILAEFKVPRVCFYDNNLATMISLLNPFILVKMTAIVYFIWQGKHIFWSLKCSSSPQDKLSADHRLFQAQVFVYYKLLAKSKCQ